jgi:hypothetical protein
LHYQSPAKITITLKTGRAIAPPIKSAKYLSWLSRQAVQILL